MYTTSDWGSYMDVRSSIRFYARIYVIYLCCLMPPWARRDRVLPWKCQSGVHLVGRDEMRLIPSFKPLSSRLSPSIRQHSQFTALISRFYCYHCCHRLRMGTGAELWPSPGYAHRYRLVLRLGAKILVVPLPQTVYDQRNYALRCASDLRNEKEREARGSSLRPAADVVAEDVVTTCMRLPQDIADCLRLLPAQTARVL